MMSATIKPKQNKRTDGSSRSQKSSPAGLLSGTEGGGIEKVRYQGSRDEAAAWRAAMGYTNCLFVLDELVGYRDHVYRITNLTRRGGRWQLGMTQFDVKAGKFLPGIETVKVVSEDEVTKMSEWLPQRQGTLLRALKEVETLAERLSINLPKS